MPELTEYVRSGIVYFTDDALFDATGVRIAFTARSGGVSKPPYDSLNVATHVGDSADDVAENRDRLLRTLGAVPDVRLIVPNQVHGTDVVIVDDACADGLQLAQERADQGADCVAVRVPDVAALLCFADCASLILVAENGEFAVAHAGWRGAYAGMAHVALEALGDTRFCNAYLGPHICGDCFETSAQIAEDFSKRFGDGVCKDGRHVDLSAVIKADLVSNGFDPARIADVGRCTMDEPEIFYSYRASGGTCGRHGALAYRRAGR